MYTLEDIKPKKKHVLLESHSTVVDHNISGQHNPPEDFSRSTRRVKTKFILWIFFLLLLVGGVMYALYYFRKATITVYPVHIKGVVDTSFIFKPGNDEGLAYELMVVPGEATVSVTATETKVGDAKATGTVVIYNTTTQEQILQKGTRLLSDSGLLFFTQEKITLGPQKVIQGKTIPGQKEVIIIAEKARTEYNIPQEDFSLPGLIGTTRAKKIYARGKTSFAGGYTGVSYVLNKETYMQALVEATEKIRVRLQDEALKQIPNGYLLYPALTFFSEENKMGDESVHTQATIEVKQQGKITAILLKKDILEKTISKMIVRDQEVTEQFEVQGLSNLKASFVGATSDINGTLPLEILFEGDVDIIMKPDLSKIKENVLGQDTKLFQTLFEKVPGVLSVELVQKPGWAFRLPTKPERVTVIFAKE